MGTLPIEILDLIIDAAVEGTSTRTVFGVTFAPELIPLLKSIALVCHRFRERAQRHLFHEIRLHPSVILDDPVATERSLSIFEDNPRLLVYPRSLLIMDPDSERVRVSHSAFSQYFLSVLFPFFTNKLRNLDHLCISLKVPHHWPKVPRLNAIRPATFAGWSAIRRGRYRIGTSRRFDARAKGLAASRA
jgi:hypothetical protein